MAWLCTLGRGSLGYLPRDYFDAPIEDDGSGRGGGGGGGGGGNSAQPWEQEFDRTPYPGNFHDMSEALNLFALVVCFVSVFPAAPVILIAMNLLHIRMSAYNMVAKSRRPVPEAVNGLGLWCELVDIVGIMCILTNSGIIVFTCNYFDDQSDQFKFLLWLTSVTAFLVIRGAMQHFIPDEPFGLGDVRKRHRFLRLKHVFGFVEVRVQISNIYAYTEAINLRFTQYIIDTSSQFNRVEAYPNPIQSDPI